MHRTSAALLLPFASLVAAYCPLYGPAFPAPKDYSSDAFQEALKNLTTSFDTTASNISGAVSAQIFSLYSDKPVWEYYHDGTTLNETGVTKVDGDSIFRVASISKLITVYLLLKEVGESYWEKSVVDVIPELKSNEKWKENEIDFVKWKDVTIGSLAGQLASLPRDFIIIDGSNPFYLVPTLPGMINLPVLEDSEKPACTYGAEGSSCTREQFFAALDTRQPLWRANTQPLYSNTGFVILGYALETITGKEYREVVQGWADALGLTSTSVAPPEASKGIIPYNQTEALWPVDTGLLAPTGGLFSSANDLSKIGRSILNSTFLDPSTTRSWLKPTSFTSDVRSAVGRPWEIYRIDTKSERGVIDVFGKGGDTGPYHSWFGVIPDYNIGFSLVVAGDGNKDVFSTYVTEIVLPALEVEAREQADAAYAATYYGNDNGIETTIKISTRVGKVGLGVDSWMSNGTDIMETLTQLSGEPHNPENFRLLPTNLERDLEGGWKQVSWRALLSVETPNEKTSPFSACGSWFNADSTNYGYHTFDEVLFNLNPEGKVISVNPRAWKIEVKRP